jgi:hypothetical protein
MRTSSTKNSLIIGISIVLGASLLSAGISNAAGSTIKACAKKSNGAMRLIASAKKCKSSERTLSWGTKGASGAKGAAGTSGVSYATYTTNTLLLEMGQGDAPYTVASLDNLAAGDYLMQANLNMGDNGIFIGEVRCRFFIAVGESAFMASPYGYVNFNSDYNVKNVSIPYALENLPGGDYDKIDFQCYVSGVGPTIDVDRIIMSATKVDTLSENLLTAE